MIKQKLLATTALVSLVAGSAFAGGPAPSMHNDMGVKIGGMYDAKLLLRDAKHDQIRSLTPNNRNILVDTKAEVFIEAKNSTAKGLEYGAHIGLRTNTVTSKQPQKGLDRSWLWMEHADMGRVEFGSNNDASESMRQGADRVAVATGGISGDWFKILSEEAFTNLVSLDSFHLKPWNVSDNALDLTLDNTADNDSIEKARKINYYSPKMNGFQIGISYTPDTQAVGSASYTPNNASIGSTTAANFDVVSGGLTWEGDIYSGATASFGLVGSTGKSRYSVTDGTDRAVDNLKAFDIGGVVSHNKLKFAASYGNTQRTGYQEAVTAMKKAWYATAGASYEFDKLVASATYFHGNKNENTSNVFSLGADYHLASGIMPYAEVTHYSLKLKKNGGIAVKTGLKHGTSGANAITNASGTTKTDGTAFILGTKLSF